jgi:hypothetical protein
MTSRNPYPTKPGFGLRVARLTRALKHYGMGWSEEDAGMYSRTFDNRLENYDGDAVVWRSWTRPCATRTSRAAFASWAKRYGCTGNTIYKKHAAPDLIAGAA